MSEKKFVYSSVSNEAIIAKKKMTEAFLKKGITIATVSGISYGLYSAFVTVAMGEGIWADWYGEKTILSDFVTVYILGALGSALNDSMSAIWAWIMAVINGKAGDFFRTINTKPGRMMMTAAIIGGPIAGTAYIIALHMAGSIVIPISALCPAIGAILGRIIFKQELNFRIIFGVIVCFLASVIIGSASISGGEINKQMIIGMVIAFIAAIGWGFEGVIGGYGTTLIDFEVGIMIRQTTSGLVNLLILVPILGLINGNAGETFELIGQAITNESSIIYFVVSGFFSLFAFSLWYKGNSMCGAALGMACNGAYSLWGPLFCWIIIGIGFGRDGFGLAGRVWFSAVIMFIGILIIAMNPLDILKKQED